MKNIKRLFAAVAAVLFGLAVRADVTLSSDGATSRIYRNATVMSGGTEDTSVFFYRSYPDTAEVALEPGKSETFCVDVSTSEYNASKCQWWLKQDGGTGEDTLLTPIEESNGLACEFSMSEEGTYYIIFQLSDGSLLNEWGDTQIAWMVTVGEGGKGDGGGSSVRVTVAGDPQSYEEGGANLSLGDGDTQVIKATVTISPETEVDYVWSCSSSGASVTVNPSDPTECSYRHAASTGVEYICLDVYPKGNMDNWLGGASWCVESKPAIVASPALTDGVMGEAYGPISFSVPNQSSVYWQNVPAFAVSRRANTFADVMTKVPVSTRGQISRYASQELGFSFPIGGATLTSVTVYDGSLNWSGYLSGQYASVGIAAGLNSGNCLYEKDGDGIYFASDGASATFRWKYELETYGSSAGGTGSTGSDGKTEMTVTTNDVNFAITLAANGEIAMSYGACGGATVDSQYVSAYVAGVSKSGSNPGGEIASSTMQDVIFTKAGLPNGLAFNQSYGILSGTPTETGTFSFTVSAYVPTLSTTLTKDCTITIAEPPPAEIIVTPALTDGKVNETYPDTQFSVSGKTLGSGYNWRSIPAFNEARQANSFVGRGGDQITLNTDYTATEVKLPFDFPCGGTSFSTFEFYSGQNCLRAFTDDRSYNLSITPLQCDMGIGFVTTDGDGIFYSTDNRSWATFRWQASKVAGYDYDSSTGRSIPTYSGKVNYSVTLKSDGGIVFAYGECADSTLNDQSVSGYFPNTSCYYQHSVANPETISATTEDLVLTAGGLPPGLSFSTGSGWLTGTPTTAGTYNFTVQAYLTATAEILSTNCTIVVAEGDPVPTYQQKTPAIGEGTLNMAATQEQDFTVEAQNEASDVVYQWYLNTTSGNFVGIAGATAKTFRFNANTYGNGTYQLCFLATSREGEQYGAVTWNVIVDGVTAPTWSSSSPEAYAVNDGNGNQICGSGKAISMTEGSTATFAVTVNNPMGVALKYKWFNGSGTEIGSESSCEYTYAKGDGLSVYVCTALDEQLFSACWTVTEGGEGGGEEGSGAEEKDYIPIPAPDNDVIGERFAHRVSLTDGAEFSKKITGAGGAEIYSSFRLTSELPAGVTLDEDGTLAGTMSDDLVDETILLDLVLGCATPVYTNRVALTFAKRVIADTTPYAAYSLPTNDDATVYLNNEATFKIYAYDEEDASLAGNYIWYLDGEETAFHSDFYNMTMTDPDQEGSTHSLVCCGSDGTSGETILKTWNITIAQPTFAFATTALPIATVGGSPSTALSYVLPSGASVVGLDLIDGTLPPGCTPFSDGSLSGIYRQPGQYEFTLRATCSNGATAEQTFAVSVSGEGTGTRTWTVGSGKSGATTKSAASGSSDKGGEYYPAIASVLQCGAAAGDTITVNSIIPAYEDLSAYKYLTGINVILNGNITLTVGRHIPDITPITLGDYKITFAIDSANYALDEDLADNCEGGHFGAKVRIVRVGTDKDAADYPLVTNVSTPYFPGTPAIDEEGYLYVTLGLVQTTENDDRLNLPDLADRRHVLFSGATFARNVWVDSDGVLPGTITFSGTNTFAAGRRFDLAFLEDVKTVVKGDAVLVFGAGAGLDDSKYAGIAFEAGATLKFDPNESVNRFAGYKMFLPKTGRIRLELTAELPMNRTCTISARYVGDDDPSQVFEIVPCADDTHSERYKLLLGGENELILAAYPETGDGDAGELVWTDAETLTGVAQGDAFAYTFTAHGPTGSSEDDASSADGTSSAAGTDDTESGSSGDAYGNYTYAFADALYAKSRDTKNTFDAALGSRELLFGARFAGAQEGSVPVEIGFPFPCADGLVATVSVNQNSISFGSSTLVLLDKGFLPDVAGLLSHLYVARTDDSFTVRYGTFAAVTLHADGTIRLAFGPDADTFSVVDPQVPLCTLNGAGATIGLSSAEGYAGSNDFLLTPNGPLGLAFSGATLSGRPLRAGNHTLRVKVTARDGAENLLTMTRTFNLTVTEAAKTEPVLTVTAAPEAAADGFVHLDLGETAKFAATVPNGCKIRWTFDDAVASTVGAGSYTLNVPATRTLDATGAKIHRLAVEADDSAGRYGWSVRKVWHVIYNRKVYVDTTSTASTAGGGAASGGRSGGGTAADGLSVETAYTDFPAGMFKYLLNGDEVIVKPGTYTTPIDFEDNAAQVTIRATEGASNTVVDVANAGRCFRQGSFAITTGKSGGLEKIFLPSQAATVEGLAFRHGAIQEDPPFEAQTLFPESSTNYCGVAGGGAFGGTFSHCRFSACSARDYGGGAYGATLSHCVVEDCTAKTGGGCANCSLMNCAIVGNAATEAAGGIDGQCVARSCILYGNVAADKANDYDNTTTPVRLVPYVPTLAACFTTADGDPMFCADYHLASGSPAEGKGAYPNPDATACLVFVEIIGGGTVTPNFPDGKEVALGDDLTLTAGDERTIAGIFTNGVEISAADLDAAILAKRYTLPDVRVNTTVTFDFAPTTLRVGATQAYKTIGAAIDAARSGDTIQVDPGTYLENLNVSAFVGTLVIEASDANNKPVVDGQSAGRCVIAKRGSEDVVFRNIVFVNGYATVYGKDSLPTPGADGTLFPAYAEADLLNKGVGGGVFGGAYENCVISNCWAGGSLGGGAFMARLVNCTVSGNVAGSKTDDRVDSVFGGGAYGGYLDTCRVSGNYLRTQSAQTHARCEGAGTYDAEVRNSYVWDNYVDCGSGTSAIPSGAVWGANGVVVHTEEKAPTSQRVAAHREPIPQTGSKTVYATHAEAQSAAAKQTVDIPTEIARQVPSQTDYANLFEIKTVEDGNGGFVNKPELKATARQAAKEQIASVLQTDDSGNRRESIKVQKMEKILVTTTPGLYYALEFSSDLSAGSFKGERHLATGSGSVKISATSLDTPDGFWRVRVYTSAEED